MKTYEQLSLEYKDILDCGFECGEGWARLIESTLNVCQHRIQNTKGLSDFKFVQIKEKFGGLRMYYTSADQYISGVIDLAERLSYTTCETCGAPGARKNYKGWLQASCPEHQLGHNTQDPIIDLAIEVFNT
jgi:hypothetical protein